MGTPLCIRLSIAIVLIGLTGCDGRSASQEKTQTGPASDEKALASDLAPAATNADIEIAPAAAARLVKVTGRTREIRVRLEFTPGGCSGMMTHLSLQEDRPGQQDGSQKCGDICVC
jgi:hypothetical protein